jgi:hypothetical protein
MFSPPEIFVHQFHQHHLLTRQKYRLVWRVTIEHTFERVSVLVYAAHTLGCVIEPHEPVTARQLTRVPQRVPTAYHHATIFAGSTQAARHLNRSLSAASHAISARGGVSGESVRPRGHSLTAAAGQLLLEEALGILARAATARLK